MLATNFFAVLADTYAIPAEGNVLLARAAGRLLHAGAGLAPAHRQVAQAELGLTLLDPSLPLPRRPLSLRAAPAFGRPGGEGRVGGGAPGVGTARGEK